MQFTGSSYPPLRPYLFEALYNWLVDNRLTPQIYVAVGVPGVEVPESLRMNDYVVFNIATSAVKDFYFDKEQISFYARFNKIPHLVVLPFESLVMIYPRENSELVYMFPQESAYSINRDVLENEHVNQSSDLSSSKEGDSNSSVTQLTEETNKQTDADLSTKGSTSMFTVIDNSKSKEELKNENLTNKNSKEFRPVLEIVTNEPQDPKN
jgi:stringent starvation protein B